MNATQEALLERDPVLRNLKQRCAEMYAELLRNDQKRELAAIEADPLAHKLTRLWGEGPGPRYRYWGDIRNGKGQRVRYCWSTNRNAAGFFLGWREVWMKNGTGKRDQYVSRRSRQKVKDIARRRHDAMKAKSSPSLE